MTNWRICAMLGVVSQSDYIGSAEAAELLGWSRAKVKREAQSGAIPVALKMPGETGAYLFLRSDIEQLIQAAA